MNGHTGFNKKDLWLQGNGVYTQVRVLKKYLRIKDAGSGNILRHFLLHTTRNNMIYVNILMVCQDTIRDRIRMDIVWKTNKMLAKSWWVNDLFSLVFIKGDLGT